MPVASTIVDVLQGHAAAAPERRAYVYLPDGEVEGGSLTYGQLDRQARRMASLLLEFAAPGERAMLLYPVGLEYLVGFFGCLYAGIVAVPAYPLRVESRAGGRLRTMIEDCGARLFLTTGRGRPGLENALAEMGSRAGDRVLATDELTDGGEAALPRPGPAQVAFLQYTSASIAQAKGVRVTHANLLANQAMIRHAMAHDERSDFVSWLPPYHDMGLVGNLLQPLYLGAACTFMPPAAFVQKPLRWLAAISRYRARTSGAPNFAYDLCVRKAAEADLVALDLSSWAVAYCGAEAVAAGVYRRFCERFAACGFRPEAFFPCYGLAEATLLASGGDPHAAPAIVEVDPAWLERGRLRVVAPQQGRALVGCGGAPPEADIRVVDPQALEPLEEGAVGEIWIRGPHVADGYWGRPQATSEVFQARIAGRSESYLRTGDLGCLLEGELYVVGRIKEIIIHRGRNIYPTDVESVALQALGPHADDCVAFAVPDEGTEGVALVVEAARRALADDAAQALGETVAAEVARAFEVGPARIVFVRRGRIPRTSSGKKQRLLCARQLASGELAVVAEWRGPRQHPAEDGAGEWAWLVGLIARVTGLTVADVSAGTDGASGWSLDSLRAIEVAHAIERRTGAVLPVALFYEAHSFAELIGEIERRRPRERRDEGPQLAVSGGGDSEVEVTPGQEAVWFSQQTAPDSTAFHLEWALRSASPLDEGRLREAVRDVIARHDALRCVFALSAERGLTGRTLAAGVVDYAFSEGSDAAVLEWLQSECARPFRLGLDLLVRVRHGRAPQGDVVAFVVHHAVADLWSCALFTEEVLERYVTGTTLGRAPAYGGYVERVRRAERESGAHADYWRALLGGGPGVDPVDLLAGSAERPLEGLERGERVEGQLDRATSGALLASARRLRVSRQMLMLSVYGLSLWSVTRLPDFVTGCLSSGRGRLGFERLQGLLANPFGVRFRLSGATTLGELLASVRAQVLGALQREEYPFQAVVRDLKCPRELRRNPLFQNMFVYQQLPRASRLAACVMGGDPTPFEHRGLQLSCVRLARRVARYDLTLYAIEVEGCLTYEVVYRSALLARRQVGELATRFETLLRRAIDSPADASLERLAADPQPALQA